jgi:type IV pilus assembly protein PilC
MTKKKETKKESEKKPEAEPEEVKLIQPSELGKTIATKPMKNKTIAELAKEVSQDLTTAEPQPPTDDKISTAANSSGGENSGVTPSETTTEAEKATPDSAPKKAEKAEKPPKEKKPKRPSKAFFLHVPLQEKVLFTRHLSIGIKSGMTLTGALELIREQTRSRSLKIIIDQVMEDIQSGIFLAKSLERYKNVFGNLFINIIKIGESSGTLSENLNYLTEELKKRAALHSKVRGALIYPSVVLVATIGIAGAMIIFIFPKILPVFASLDIKLPFTTRALIALSNALSNHGLLIGVGAVLFVIGVIVLLKIRAVKHVVHHVLLYVPVVRKIVVQVNMANFARTFGLLLKSGVNIIEAVNITAETTENLVYQHELKASSSVLQKGEFLSSYLSKNSKLFPPIAANMIRVGENTGNLVDNLDYVSGYYEGEVDDFVKNLSSIIEPALMLVMGVIVGFIALSIITPIYSLTQGLTR